MNVLKSKTTLYVALAVAVGILFGLTPPPRNAEAQADVRSVYRKFPVQLVAAGVTPAATDTVLTVDKVLDKVVTAGVTSYTITAGRSLLVQGIYAQFTQSSAVATRVQVFLRYNSAGACVAASSRQMAMELAPQAFGTAAALTGSDPVIMPIPYGGWELKGDGTVSICLSAIASSAAGTLTLTLVGYEY